MPPSLERLGYWGQPTSTLDWCEENYEVTWYIAEFWNTITNISMVIPPLYGIYECKRQGFERRFMFCHFMLLLVGIGSSMFHMTLKYEMQLLDELPMVWGSIVMIYCLLQTRADPVDKGLPYAIMLFTYGLVFTIVYIAFKNPLIMQVMYGILVAVMILVDIRSLIGTKLNSPVVKVYVAGIALYGGGFILWNIDNQFCSGIKHLRGGLSPNAQPFTQLHGWWHLAAGYATYMHTVYCIHQRAQFMKRPTQFSTSWIGLVIQRTLSSKSSSK